MPIAQITVAPRLAATVSDQADRITAAVKEALVDGLSADPCLVQVTIAAALAAPAGCETLCQVQHRASGARTAPVREATARRLHDILKDATGATVRVRLIALDPAHIAAVDSPEALS